MNMIQQIPPPPRGLIAPTATLTVTLHPDGTVTADLDARPNTVSAVGARKMLDAAQAELQRA